jgi:hypothetical protein
MVSDKSIEIDYAFFMQAYFNQVLDNHFYKRYNYLFLSVDSDHLMVSINFS